jgi:hypothetical protein
VSLQRVLSEALYPAIVPKGTLELPADLFSASSRSQTEGQRLPDAAMRGLLPSSLVASEHLGPLLRPIGPEWSHKLGRHTPKEGS